MKCYVVGENNCLVEAYTKEEIENKDVTLKFTIEKINGTEASKDILYPDGFHRDNCEVVGLAYKTNNESYKKTSRYNPYGEYYYIPFADLGPNVIRAGLINSHSSGALLNNQPIEVFVTLRQTKIIDASVLEYYE